MILILTVAICSNISVDILNVAYNRQFKRLPFFQGQPEEHTLLATQMVNCFVLTSHCFVGFAKQMPYYFMNGSFINRIHSLIAWNTKPFYKL